ncbi:uncharacterized protein LOC128348308 isoform X2 [Hemicordylus capensis]|uniref:uncharacterized protein LOC128341522 isoform X2 n=1 Tax=Hemicordylus capensis TaxID=884348 RepID=UPI002302BD23|nr:uncharacterized protein LOC128341522 isoform X2 [Hemicordylus capensis]XP_053160139.1 uncharacterized protein LOC128348308 isoform X2 [Hemicordylus capensis]
MSRSDYWDLTTGVEKMERAEEIMEDIKKHPDPGFLLSLTMDTLTELSKMKPALPFNVKAAVLHMAVSGVDHLDPGTQEKMASFKKMLRGLLEDAPSIQDTIGILKELHKYINSEKPRLQTLGREAYIDALAHVARLPNVEVSTLLWTWLQHPLLHLLLQHPLWDPLSSSRFRRRPPSGLWSHGGCRAAYLLERGCFHWGSPNAPGDSSRGRRNRRELGPPSVSSSCPVPRRATLHLWESSTLYPTGSSSILSCFGYGVTLT